MTALELAQERWREAQQRRVHAKPIKHRLIKHAVGHRQKADVQPRAAIVSLPERRESIRRFVEQQFREAQRKAR